MDREQIIIFDTTLRDGEQALRSSLSKDAKLHIAKSLERLGVDYIEAGFPVSSPGDFDSVKTIAGEIKTSKVVGLCRALPGDIEAAAQALSVADSFRIHTFIATSPLHLSQKLKMDISATLDATRSSVALARKFTDDVEFSCEDAGRTPLEDLLRFVETAIDAGATTVNIPDTVGYTIPTEYGGIIAEIMNRVPNIDKAVLSVHCHDDLGLSVANSMAAITAGARQVEGTINGLGERAGNCALEEIIMILETRKDIYPFKTNINICEIYPTSQVVANRCHMEVQANKAIVGDNAFTHSSGIHQDGVLKEKKTYEIMTPESIGVPSMQLNMTSRSGRHVIRHRLSVLGYKEGENYDLDSFYESFLKLADSKGVVYDYDLEALIWLDPADTAVIYELVHLNALSGTEKMGTATIKMTKGDKVFSQAAVGNGPVNAVFNAIDEISGKKFKLLDYKILSQGVGREAHGQVDVVIAWSDRTYHGTGFSTDIVEASTHAYINVLNAVEKSERVEKKSADIGKKQRSSSTTEPSRRETHV